MRKAVILVGKFLEAHSYYTVCLILELCWNTNDTLEGKSYALSGFLTTWHGANQVCRSNGAQLASVSEQEDPFLRIKFTDATLT